MLLLSYAYPYVMQFQIEVFIIEHLTPHLERLRGQCWAYGEMPASGEC